MNRQMWITALLVPFVILLCWIPKLLGTHLAPNEDIALQLLLGLAGLFIGVVILMGVVGVVWGIGYCLWTWAGMIEEKIPTIVNYCQDVKVKFKDWWIGEKK